VAYDDGGGKKTGAGELARKGSGFQKVQSKVHRVGCELKKELEAELKQTNAVNQRLLYNSPERIGEPFEERLGRQRGRNRNEGMKDSVESM